VLQLEAVPVEPVGQVVEALRLLGGQLRQGAGLQPRGLLRPPGSGAPDSEQEGAGRDQRQGDGAERRYASSSSLPVPPTPAMVATVSPSSRRMMITPWVWRPLIRIFSTGVRITWPPSEITISCSSS
jgi:hypothetical protein